MAIVDVKRPVELQSYVRLEDVIKSEINKIFLERGVLGNKELISALRDKGIKVERRKSKYYNNKLVRINYNTLRKLAPLVRREYNNLPNPVEEYNNLENIVKVNVYHKSSRVVEEIYDLSELLNFKNQFFLRNYLRKNAEIIKKDDDFYLKIKEVDLEIPYQDGNLFKFVVNIGGVPRLVYVDNNGDIRGCYELEYIKNRYLY